MSETKSEKTSTAKKKKKQKGPIRFEAIVPVLTITVAIASYYIIFFDGHLKYALETAGYYVHGAEVNIATLDTSFSKAAVNVAKIQVTNTENPDYNLISIDRIQFGMLWDALLRGKFVVKIMSVEGIRAGSKRKKRGQVRPPEDQPEEQGPGILASAASKVGDDAAKKINQENQGNALGNIAAIVGGANPASQLGNIEGALNSKKKMAELEKGLKDKEQAWKKRISELPNSQKISALENQVKGVKTSNFKSPQELQQSIKKFQGVIAQADGYVKQISTAQGDFNKDFSNTNSSFGKIDSWIKQDIKDLEKKMKIPSLEVGELSKELFMKYLNSYIGPYKKYIAMAQEYIPAPSKGGKKDDKPKPKERKKGKNYRFGTPNSYPLVWIKKVKINSRADDSDLSANLDGELTDATTDQKLVGRPTDFVLTGNVPGGKIEGIDFKARIDRISDDPKDSFSLKVKSFPVGLKKLSGSKELSLDMNPSVGKLNLIGIYKNEKLNLKINNQLQKVSYKVSAPNKDVQDIVTGAMRDLSRVSIEATARGPLFGLAWSIKSSIGSQLEKAFKKQLDRKLEAAKKKIRDYVNSQVEKEKKKIEAQVNKIKTQFQGQLSKLQGQADSQKKKAEGQVSKAKGDAENKVRKEKARLTAETDAKIKAQQDKIRTEQARIKAEQERKKKAAEKKAQKKGNKELDKLKKKFGF